MSGKIKRTRVVHCENGRQEIYYYIASQAVKKNETRQELARLIVLFLTEPAASCRNLNQRAGVVLPVTKRYTTYSFAQMVRNMLAKWPEAQIVETASAMVRGERFFPPDEGDRQAMEERLRKLSRDLNRTEAEIVESSTIAKQCFAYVAETISKANFVPTVQEVALGIGRPIESVMDAMALHRKALKNSSNSVYHVMLMNIVQKKLMEGVLQGNPRMIELALKNVLGMDGKGNAKITDISDDDIVAEVRRRGLEASCFPVGDDDRRERRNLLPELSQLTNDEMIEFVKDADAIIRGDQ